MEKELESCQEQLLKQHELVARMREERKLKHDALQVVEEDVHPIARQEQASQESSHIEKPSGVIEFGDKFYTINNFNSKNFPEQFFLWLESRVNADFDCYETEGRNKIASLIQDRWSSIDDVCGYYRIRTYVKLTCKRNEPEPEPVAVSSVLPGDSFDINREIRNYFSIAYGMTKDEIEDFEKGILPGWFNRSTTPYSPGARKVSLEPEIYFYPKSYGQFEKSSSISTFLTLLLALYLSVKYPAKDDRGFIACVFNIFGHVWESRINAFRFDPRNDDRVAFFRDLINDLSSSFFSITVDDQQMAALCSFIPLEIKERPVTDFNFMKRVYISMYGKNWKEENEVEYRDPDFNAGQFLPLELSTLKNLVKKVVRNGEDYWMNVIILNDETVSAYIRFVNDNRNEIIDKGIQMADNWVIPSGQFIGKKNSNVSYLNQEQTLFIEANCFFMGLAIDHIKDIKDIFFKYKIRETIERHLCVVNLNHGKQMSDEVLKMLLTVKF